MEEHLARFERQTDKGLQVFEYFKLNGVIYERLFSPVIDVKIAVLKVPSYKRGYTEVGLKK